MREKRAECVGYIIGKLSSAEIDIVTLYTEVLGPALNDMICEDDETTCIWHEHVRSSIVRTVVESAYPYLGLEIEEAGVEPLGKKVMVFCPPEEYHEIGARMAADMFELVGFEVTYVGANTPKEVILSAIGSESPDIAAISVSNSYHIFEAKRTISLLRERAEKDMMVVVGGGAFSEKPESFKEVGADRLVNSFQDILELRDAIC